MQSMKTLIHKSWFALYSGLAFLLLSGGCVLKAQKAQTQEIQNTYKEVNLRIERCEDEGAPCGLFLNRIQTNPGEEPWAVVGTYESTRDLWYQRDGSEETETFQLLKVNTKTYRSSRKEMEEYLFTTEGQLQFYSFQLTESGDPLQSFKFYFSKGKLINYEEQVGEDEAEYQEWSKEDGEKVQEKARKLQELLKATL